jgi:hypothetical protein
MRRRLILWIVLVVAASAVVVQSVRAESRERREIGYQAKLRTYSEAFHRGITRKELEDYLRSSHTNFSQVSTRYGYPERNEWQEADLVEIGQETPPWFCSRSPVYVAFEFISTEKLKVNDADILERIELYRPDTGCL